MDIRIGEGIGPLYFGMFEENVREILGPPDKASMTATTDSVTCTYNNTMMKLVFDKDEDNRLFSIQVANPNVTLFGQRIVGQTKQEIIDLLKEAGYTDPIWEDYGTFETINYVEPSLEFAFCLIGSIELPFGRCG